MFKYLSPLEWVPICIHQFPIHSYLLLYHNSSESPIWAVRDSRQQKITLNNPHHEKTHRLTCAPLGDSNHPAYLHSLISIFPAHEDILYPWLSKSTLWRFWSDRANAQSDLNLRWAHLSEGTFPSAAVDINDFVAHINEGSFFDVAAHINEGNFLTLRFI